MSVESKSTDKLKIIFDGLQNIPEEKMAKLDYFEIKWEEVDTVVVPNIILSFKNEAPLPENKFEREAQLADELRNLSEKYNVSFQMPSQGPADDAPLINTNKSDPFTDMNVIKLQRRT